MIDWGLIAARFLHYAGSTMLAGTAFFPLYAYSAREPVALARWRSMVLIWSALLALASGIVWFIFSVANMSGALADAFDPEILGSVVRDTGFGAVWTMRMFVAGVLVVVASRQSMNGRSDRGAFLLAALAAVLLASLAGAGHAQIEEGWTGALHVIADAAHLLAAGAWLGGLAPLGMILLRYTGAGRERVDVDQVLMRFSGMGYIAVATLVGTGLFNSWLLVGSLSSLVHSVYGQILTAKLALFAGMLGLAAANRFWLVPALDIAGRNGSQAHDVWRRKLQAHVLSEQGLGLLVLLCVSILGTIRPAIGQ